MATNASGSISPPMHPQRPPIQSQISNSVPSTPYQQARDLRYPSRSPSPHRGLGNHSPRSVVSEAVEPSVPNGTLRMPIAPVVCKWETAPEWRKRRIPYVDGGDQELAPPEKKPRASLTPEEEEKLSRDMRELYDRLLPSDESESRRAQLVQKLDRILNEEWPGNDIKVSVFGSSGNLLSSNDSDVDICVTTSLKKVESMHNLAMLLDRHGMERVVCRAAAKVPIVKCWDPVLQLACDVNVNNPLALENTRMIKTYVQLDPRVRPLAKIIKHWTKQRILNDAAFGGTISSYTWICMVISFLQQRKPPILPSLQKLPGRRSIVDGRPSAFADDVEALKGKGDENKETLAGLLFHFFRFYAYEFEYSKYVVSVKEGEELSRTEKGWDNPRDNKEARCRLCVEEPFNTSRNLGNSADDYAWSGIHGEIRRAFDLLADDLQLEKCCEKFIFPPEEKSVFQRPAPKPKPTLTRSASQSGARPNHDTHTTRSRKGSNRNQSSHRTGSRRASSGAVFNPRMPMLQSPALGPLSADYFSKSNLHEHLFQQYQFLQQQQDVLRSQLQQAQGQTSGTSSPQLRQHAFVNHRLFDGAPQTAPLLPGSPLFHFAAQRYPPQPLSALPGQSQRARDGSITNPSSPSLTNAVPVSMRHGNRTATVDGSNSAIRSQSQPGRSLPHPIALQQQVHPGYDMSGVMGTAYQSARSSQLYSQGYSGGYPYPMSPVGLYHPNMDSTAHKEYVGYFVGQSPQLGPQYIAGSQAPVSSMPSLSNPPQPRQRRVTPDLQPPIANGTSRSPSPLDTSTIIPGSKKTTPPMPTHEFEGPLIVNGSTPVAASKSRDRPNGSIASPLAPVNGENGLGLTQLPIRTTSNDTEREKPASISTAKSTRTSPHLTLSPNGTHGSTLDTATLPHEANAAAAPPLLSPVAELRTPSPTLSTKYESQAWPQTQMNGIDKQAKIANAKRAEENSLPSPKNAETKDERKASVPSLASVVAKQSTSPTLPPPLSAGLPPQDKYQWQQAVSRKGHKKNKSMANAANMQRSPVIEAERKGG
ncbi:hypothetical protein AMS68_006353 [Peltaster fructicola]|uniref:polynucleotide adenylyltransferase n=1 Tax=Peltaster fructicola TaxID=286661 RepID=A0A6H0Y1M0_9PEZI|nr:hypothetical protein AMS68_006353 [Peltaster fructicola]